MNHSRANPKQRFSHRPVVTRIRFQLGVALLLIVLVPALILPRQALDLPSTIHGAAGTSIAIILGYIFVRRLSQFPGAIAISYVLPSLVASFGLVLVGFFILRFPYSRALLTIGFIASNLWFYLVLYVSDRVVKARFALVPFGNTPRLTEIKNAEFVMLAVPELPGQPINGIVADLRADMTDEWELFLTNAAIRGVPVYHFKQVAEYLTGMVEIEHLSENTFGSLIPNIVYARIKMWIDWTIALVVTPFLLPLFLLICVAIRLDSRGPVFFRQLRAGYGGVPFRIWKFRTMECSHDGSEETKTNDPRVTRVGRFLRKTRLDELPQVFNILKAEMNWIGPRPEALNLSRRYEEKLPYYRYRHIVRPGITGWAQVNQGHVVEVDEVLSKLHYDFFYVKNYSVWLDILILIKTLRIVVSGQGAR